MSNEAMIAAAWWADQLSAVLDLTPRQVDELRGALTERIDTLRQRRAERGRSEVVRIDYDYNPDTLLTLALDDAGVDVIDEPHTRPVKNWTLIEPGCVIASAGYAGERVAIFGSRSRHGFAVDRIEPWEVAS